jgi:hypothetical protein
MRKRLLLQNNTLEIFFCQEEFIENSGQPHYKTPQEKEKRADREGTEGE